MWITRYSRLDTQRDNTHQVAGVEFRAIEEYCTVRLQERETHTPPTVDSRSKFDPMAGCRGRRNKGLLPGGSPGLSKAPSYFRILEQVRL